MSRSTLFRSRGSLQGQQGAILMMAMIILLLMGLATSTGMNQVMLQQKVNNNFQQQQILTQLAEQALLSCETALANTDINQPQLAGHKILPEDIPDSPIAAWQPGKFKQWWQDREFLIHHAQLHEQLMDGDVESYCLVTLPGRSFMRYQNQMADQAIGALENGLGFRQFLVTVVVYHKRWGFAAGLQSDYFRRQ